MEFDNKNGINVLSVFDGISAGMIALEKAGIKVNNYYASEIDKYAIKVSNSNWKDKVIHIGDIKKIKYRKGILYTENGNFNIGKIDLLIGGSPCQSFSNLGDQSGLDGKSGLFYEYLRIKKLLKPSEFLFENVGMRKTFKDQLSKFLKCEPIEINSNLVSAQNRKRLYWTSLNVGELQNRNIFLSDIIDFQVDEKYFLSDKAKKYIINKDRIKKKLIEFSTDKSLCLLARYRGLSGTFICIDNNGKFDKEKSGTLTQRYYKGVSTFGSDTYVLDGEDITKERIRMFTPEECEKLQTVPVGYTKSVSDTQRYKMLGNGWTVDVIAHIFSYLPEEWKLR